MKVVNICGNKPILRWSLSSLLNFLPDFYRCWLLKCQNWSVFLNFYAGGSEKFGPQEPYFIMHQKDLFVLIWVLTNCSENIDFFLKFLQSQHFLNI